MNYEYYRKRILIRNVILAIITLVFFCGGIFISIHMLSQHGIDSLFLNFLLAVFAVSVVVNQVVCFTLCRTLKKHFLTFYNKEKYFILGTTLIMNISMISRLAALSWTKTFGGGFDELLK